MLDGGSSETPAASSTIAHAGGTGLRRRAWSMRDQVRQRALQWADESRRAVHRCVLRQRRETRRVALTPPSAEVQGASRRATHTRAHCTHTAHCTQPSAAVQFYCPCDAPRALLPPPRRPSASERILDVPTLTGGSPRPIWHCVCTCCDRSQRLRAARLLRAHLFEAAIEQSSRAIC